MPNRVVIHGRDTFARIDGLVGGRENLRMYIRTSAYGSNQRPRVSAEMTSDT